MTPLAALDRGAGPAVLVVPGLTFPAASWTPVLAHLEGLRVVVVDLPGHGATPAWPVVRPPDVAAACAVLVAERGLGEPLVVGHSWGALAAAAYAGRWPVRGLVTLDQGLEPEDLPVPAAGLPPGAASAVASRLLGVIETSVRPDALPPATAELLRATRTRDPQVLAPYLRALEGVPAQRLLEPVTEGLSALGVPAVHVRRAAADRDAGVVQEWRASSHCLHLERPARLAALLRELLQRATAARPT